MGNLELRQMLIVVRRLCGHSDSARSGVCRQSMARRRAPISPAPVRKMSSLASEDDLSSLGMVENARRGQLALEDAVSAEGGDEGRNEVAAPSMAVDQHSGIRLPGGENRGYAGRFEQIGPLPQRPDRLGVAVLVLDELRGLTDVAQGF